MKVRELIRHLLEVENIDGEIRAINVNDPQDEFMGAGESPGAPLTSVVDVGDGLVAVYYIGPKPRVVDDE